MSGKLPLGLRLWRGLTTLATPFGPLLLSQRAARGKEDTARLRERLGIAWLGMVRIGDIQWQGPNVKVGVAPLLVGDAAAVGGDGVWFH